MKIVKLEYNSGQCIANINIIIILCGPVSLRRIIMMYNCIKLKIIIPKSNISIKRI